MKCARLVLAFLLISVVGHAAPDPSLCEAYQTELNVLDFKVMHAANRLSEAEKLLGDAQSFAEALPPRDTSTLCAEKWAGLRAIRVRLQGIRDEYDKKAKELVESEKKLDQLTVQATAFQARGRDGVDPPSEILDCAGYFSQSVTPEKVASCYNDLIGGYLRGVRSQRKSLEGLRDKDKDARREAATIRDIAAEMKCPELAPLQAPKPVGAPSLGDASAFIGKWTGTIKITAASDPSIVGISETGTLELFAAGKGVGVKGRLGVIGDPAAYQVKVAGDRLQIHYVGPSHTTATPGIPATLDYTLDVTRKGDQLIGESHSKATSSYQGQTAVVSFTQQMTLNR